MDEGGNKVISINILRKAPKKSSEKDIMKLETVTCAIENCLVFLRWCEIRDHGLLCDPYDRVKSKYQRSQRSNQGAVLLELLSDLTLEHLKNRAWSIPI
jgi:hypothetical protein